jgi:ABC-type sugar transport system substrate-binding protein
VKLDRQSRTRVLAATAAIVAVAGLTACSSSSKKASGTSAAAGSTSSAASSAAGSSSASSSGKKITIGFSPYNQSAQALVGLAKGVKAAAAAGGASTLIADPNNDPNKQAQQIKSWIELGQVQAVWALALDPTALKSLIPLAKSKHVGLVLTGTPTDYGQSATAPGLDYSIIDYTGFGKAIGTAAGQCANAKLGGNGKFLYLANPAGSTGKKAEDAAIAAALKATSPNSTIVSTISNQNDRLKSQQGTLTAVQGNQKINGAMGVIDEGTLGPMTAFKQLGRLSKTCVVGAGGSDEALAAVKAGNLYGDVAIQFGADLAQNVAAELAFAKNPTMAGKQLYTPFKTVLK